MTIFIYIYHGQYGPEPHYSVGPRIAFTISIMVTHTGYLLKCSAVGFPFQNLVMDQLLSCAKLFASFNASKQNPSNTINSRTKCWQHQFENPLTKDNLTISNMAPSKKKAPGFHVEKSSFFRTSSPCARSPPRHEQDLAAAVSSAVGPGIRPTAGSGAESESTGDKNNVPSGND